MSLNSLSVKPFPVFLLSSAADVFSFFFRLVTADSSSLIDVSDHLFIIAYFSQDFVAEVRPW